MLALVTGVPGAKKTVFVVSKLDKTESENKVNLIKNIAFYEHNQKIINDNSLQNELTYYYEDVGSGHELKQVLTVLPDYYFDILNQEYDDLRPDDYYKVATIYNIIIARIIETESIKGFKYLLPVRTIYTNINALKIDFVRSLYDLLDERSYVDWRKAPDGSIIVIDEIQLIAPFDQTKNKDEPIIQHLTVHRHRGFDFYLITQSANLLHVQMKDLIGLHWHITVPWGWVSKVYQYGSYRQNPNAVSIKMAAERKFNFSPPDRLFKLYKSTTINTHKKRIPYKPLFIFSALIIFALSLFFWAAGGSKDSKLINGMMGNQVADDVSIAQNPFDKAANPQAAKNDGSKPVDNVPPDPGIQNQENKLDDLKKERLPTHIYEASLDEAVRPASVVMMGNKCIAMNRFGERLRLDDSVCRLMISDSSMMPKAHVQRVATPSAQITNSAAQ